MKCLKRMLFFFIICILIFTNFGALAKGKGPTKSQVAITEQEYVRQFAQDIYQYFRFGLEDVFTYKTSKLVNEYLKSKKNVLDTVSEMYGLAKDELNVKTEVIRKIEQGEFNCYVVNIQARFLYKDDSEEAGEGLDIAVKCSNINGEITIENVFDGIGGVNINIWPSIYEKYGNDLAYYLSKNEDLTISNKCSIRDLETQKELELKKIKEVYEEEMKYVNNDAKNSFLNNKSTDTRASKASFNKSAVVKYARNNFNKASPNSGRRGIKYIDFSEYVGEYDCTNFTSHCFLAGGARPDGKWYCKSDKKRSKQWSSATSFYHYFIEKRTRGLRGISYNYYPFLARTAPNFELGDFIQYGNSSGKKFSHSTIITGLYTFDNKGKVYLRAKVTGRTSKRSNNDNAKAEDVLPALTKFVLRVKGI